MNRRVGEIRKDIGRGKRCLRRAKQGVNTVRTLLKMKTLT